MKCEYTLTDIAKIISAQLSATAKSGQVVSLDDFSILDKKTRKPIGSDSLVFLMDISMSKPGRKSLQSIDGHTLCDVLMTKVSLFDIHTHTTSFLERRGLVYVWQMAVLSDDALLKIEGIGKVSVRNIRRRLRLVPGYGKAVEISLRNLVFRKVFQIARFSDLAPKQELSVIMDSDYFPKVEEFIRSNIR